MCSRCLANSAAPRYAAPFSFVPVDMRLGGVSKIVQSPLRCCRLGESVPTCCPIDRSAGCTGTAMRGGTFVPTLPRYALLPAVRRPITVGLRAPDAEAYLEADGHRLRA